VLVGAACYVAARLCAAVRIADANASTIWAPSGIAVAAFVLLGRHVWPGVAAASFLSSLASLPAGTATPLAAASVAVAHTFEPWLVSELVTAREVSRRLFSRTRDAFWFVGATVLASLVGATVSATALQLLAITSPNRYYSAWLTAWIGDLAGIVVVTPALYAWLQPRAETLTIVRAIEFIAIAAVTVLAAGLMFRGSALPLIASRPHLLMVVLMWVAFRFEQRETFAMAALVSTVTAAYTWRTIHGGIAGAWPQTELAPFVNPATTPEDWLLALQVFMCTTAVVAVVLASAIAERDESERAVRHSEQLFRATIDSAPSAIVMSRQTGEIALVNYEAERLFGYGPGELLGQPAAALLPAFHDLPNDRRAAAGGVNGESGLGEQWVGVRKSGTTFPVEISINPVQTANGPCVLSAIADITERRRLETTLRDINQILERRVGDRTAALEASNRQLEGQIRERQRVEEQLRGSLQEKETLLREVHHRVKNNLAVVSSLLYLEASRASDDHTLRILHEAQQRVQSMAMVHEELYRSGNLAAIDLRDYLERLLRYLLHCYSSASGRIDVRTDMDRLLLDPDRAVPCGLIFTEVLTNTLKHAFPHGRAGTIHVRLHRAANGHHVLTVGDNGIGLAPGLDVERASTLGWRLVQGLSRQLDGAFAIRDADPGTEAVLQFPGRSMRPS
jgi:PAS domain S-box-containing protein